MTKKLLLLLLVAIPLLAFTQKNTVHGYIKDKSNGEALIGATVYIKGTSTGTVSNSYGFYSLSLAKGQYQLVVSFIGYKTIEKSIDLQADVPLNIDLEADNEQIEEVLVTAEGKNENIRSTNIGLENIASKTIQKLPKMMGEADVIKTLQLLPGVVATSELSSNLSVRGGARDQNLILLDEAMVYNASHLLGLFSAFNNDAIKSVDLYKGMIPCIYGGSISSVMDIRMKEGSTRNYAGNLSIGTMASRLMIEGPVIKDKSSFMISGRRTYYDVLTKMMHKLDTNIPKVPYYFYDLNAKANYTINDKHRLFISGYFGRDVYDSEYGASQQSLSWGNYTGTLRWNWLISNRLFANTTFMVNNYDYKIATETSLGDKSVEYTWDAFLKDINGKIDLGYFLNPDNTIKFGMQTTFHNFNVAKVKGHFDTLKFDYDIPKMYCYEHKFYIGNQQKLSENINLDYGFNIGILQCVGKATVYNLNRTEEDGSVYYKVVSDTTYSKGNVYKTYKDIDPRFSLSWAINPDNSIKIGYNRTHQYLHIASNSNSGTPLDVWMPVTNNVKPQYAHQVAMGYFSNFLGGNIKTSAEVYYKAMYNQIEFAEFSQPIMNPHIEEDFRFGKGRAFGLELMVRKEEGRFTGWVSYTLSKSERKTIDIQDKSWYPSPYDQRHNLSVVGMYDLTKHFSASLTWLYNTGKPFDAPSAKYQWGNVVLPYYNGKNASKYPNYHRLDLSLEYKINPQSKFQSSLTLSVFNVYNRKNANVIYFKAEEGFKTQAYRIAMMQRIFALSYNLNF
jgi:hypothetical protein